MFDEKLKLPVECIKSEKVEINNYVGIFHRAELMVDIFCFIGGRRTSIHG